MDKKRKNICLTDTIAREASRRRAILSYIFIILINRVLYYINNICIVYKFVENDARRYSFNDLTENVNNYEKSGPLFARLHAVNK